VSPVAIYSLASLFPLPIPLPLLLSLPRVLCLPLQASDDITVEKEGTIGALASAGAVPPAAGTATRSSDALVDPTRLDEYNLRPRIHPTGSLGASELVKSLIATRSSEPLSSYTQNSDLLINSFGYLFPLGQGPFTNQPVTPVELDYLMHFHDRRFCRDTGFLAVCNDHKRLVECARTTGSKFRTDASSIEAATQLLNSRDLDARLAAATSDPSGEEARALTAEFSSTVHLVSASIPYSPFERSVRAAPMLSAYVRMFGPPTAFFTVAPDERFTTLVARLSVSSTRGTMEAVSLGDVDPVKFWKGATEQEALAAMKARRAHLAEETDAMTWSVKVSEEVFRDPAAVAGECVCVERLNQLRFLPVLLSHSTVPPPPPSPSFTSPFALALLLCAEMSHKMMDVIMNTLVMPRSDDDVTGQRRTRTMFDTPQVGIFGTCLASFIVSELQGRGMLVSTRIVAMRYCPFAVH
jgi:hypothetical protein